jgi:glycosyltransferase involved in cell wall biosynthesis
MRILFLTQYYPPETGAPQNRIADLVSRLTQSSHLVTVLTALPNYPHGEIFEGYQGHFSMEEREGGARILRTWVYATKSKGFLPRLLNYFSFALTCLWAGLFKIPSQDLVVVESPPLFLGLSGLLISRWKRAKLVLNISDLWPESAVALGILRASRLIRLATRFEEFLYRHADLITGQTQGIVESIRSRCNGKPVVLMPNGVNVEHFAPAAEFPGPRERIRGEYGLHKQFVVGYAGLHGLAQGLRTVLDAAQLLSHHSDICFVFFGDGPEKPQLSQMAEEAQLSNVRFFSSQPWFRMPEILSALDVSLVPLKRHSLFEGALPSKMFEAMGAGVPVIVSIDGEARALVEKSRGGIYVEPQDPRAMAHAILKLHEDPALRKFLGDNGRRFVTNFYNRCDIATKFEQFLLACISSKPDGQPETQGNWV